MLDFKNKIKNWFSKLNKRESSYEKSGIRPKKDWEIILTTTTLALVVLGLIAGYFYIQVNRGELFKVSYEDKESEVKISQNLLDKTVSDINNRKKSLESIKNGGVVPPDPSL